MCHCPFNPCPFCGGGGGGGILPLSAMSAFVSFLGVILLSALSKLMPILFNFCPICQFGPLFCPF